MSGFELNKILAAVLLAGVIGMTTGFVAELMITPETLEQNAYVVEGGAVEIPTEEEEALPPIAPLLASADPAAGEARARTCIACHSFDQGGANGVGPNLWGILERPIAGVDGFRYSAALQDHAGEAPVWSYEELNGFLYRPRDWVRGTSMSYAGVRGEDERANIIAYLRTLAEDPVALPVVDEAAADGGEEAAGDEAPAEGEAPAEAEGGDDAPEATSN